MSQHEIMWKLTHLLDLIDTLPMQEIEWLLEPVADGGG